MGPQQRSEEPASTSESMCRPEATTEASTAQNHHESTWRGCAAGTAISEVEDDVTRWIERLTGDQRGTAALDEWLHDGRILCGLANVIQPGIIKRVNQQNLPFKKMENITAFIGACRTLGVLEKDVFSTVDLYESKNLKS